MVAGGNTNSPMMTLAMLTTTDSASTGARIRVEADARSPSCAMSSFLRDSPPTDEKRGEEHGDRSGEDDDEGMSRA